jgi:TrpR-related protein YerC/YecD
MSIKAIPQVTIPIIHNLPILAAQLCNAYLQFQTQNEVYAFLKDICTPAEIKSMQERLEVANLLMAGFLSYREIHELTKVSIATITRVARFLLHENNNGYKIVLKRLNESGLLPRTDDESNTNGLSPLALQLCNAFLQLKTPQEVHLFLKDICTPAEVKSMQERLEVAKLLMDDFLSYREIHELTRVSIATITRVARFLLHETHNGYKVVLKRLADAGLLVKSDGSDATDDSAAAAAA